MTDVYRAQGAGASVLLFSAPRAAIPCVWNPARV